jgi:hypothetical protein
MVFRSALLTASKRMAMAATSQVCGYFGLLLIVLSFEGRNDFRCEPDACADR